MGMYICADCFDKTSAKPEWFSCVAACEVCGNLKNDWSSKFCNFTWDLERFASPEELKKMCYGEEP